MSVWNNFKNWVFDTTMKAGNSIMEGLTAGYWQGKDVYNGFGKNPAPSENVMMQDAKTELKNEGTNAPTIPSTNAGTADTSGGVEDKTNENIEIPMYYGENDIFNWIEAQQQKQYEREDSIRNAVWEREDSAYQRATEDLIRAGINPNLVDIAPATSGGGITNATGKDYTVYEQEMNKYLEELEMLFDKSFQGSENDKDRVIELIKSVMTLFGATTIANAKTKK